MGKANLYTSMWAYICMQMHKKTPGKMYIRKLIQLPCGYAWEGEYVKLNLEREN